MEKKVLKTYVQTMIGDTETPITLYQKYVRKGEGFLLESKEQPKGRYSFLATNPFIVVKAHDNQIAITTKGKTIIKEGKPLEEVKRIIDGYDIINETKLPFVGGAVGTVGYDTIKQYEKIPAMNIDSIGTPDVHLMFVKEGIAYDHFNHTIYIVALEEDNDQGRELAEERIYEIKMMLKKDIIFDEEDIESEKLVFQSNVSKKTFEDAVNKAKSYIYEGDIFQVVLSQRWSARCETSPFTLYRRLRRLNPSPYMYYFKFDDYDIVGSSPEMLVELMDGKISNCPIAGTRRRGKTEEEDKLLAEDLMGDEKEIAEHIMLVDLGRNDMGKVSKIGTVNVAKYMEVQNYSHVMHIVSLVEGEKRDDQDMFQVLMSFLPAGTLSGAPKIRAMEIIEELEISKRGIYGGAIGYFGFNQTMDMCIAIRTMVIKDNVVHIQAGAGIVADSIAEAEYEETRNKAQALITAINN
ncbi:MAG: anthranilate synthase component I [Firmicutes bacterium HGW-Firmicutes-1]|jgi:anthranilate synthase component 1|nr:MAG: anthranilate synthase component I [Firmicutes bacterium HGW-Firmicutes-1]